VTWTPIGGFPGWVGTSIDWTLEPADGGGTIVHFTHDGWSDEQAAGEMAMCGYTWAMIIDRLAGGSRDPYFKAGEPLPR
jgi:uncharacterized protein YndB with AHSA1/START domain